MLIGSKRRSLLVPKKSLFVPCSGAAIHLTSPNDLSNATVWNAPNVTPNFNATDPNGVANNATDLKSSVGGGSFNTVVNSQGANIFNLAALTGTYAFGAYFKSIAGPPWIRFLVFDGGSNYFGAWFNISTASPAAGNSIGNGGTGRLDCSGAGAAGNGYTQVSFAGHVTSDTPNMFIRIDLVDGNGTGASTLNQEIYAWQVSP